MLKNLQRRQQFKWDLGMGQNPNEPQNSWVKMDVNKPLKMVSIGIDPYPHDQIPTGA